jgi:lipoyl(octanoyl) transferase
MLATYGVAAGTIRGLTGVWVQTPAGDAKIAAIGVRVNVKAITKHGIALNLNTDLRGFDGIIPCGIPDKGVTRLADLLNHPVDESEARARFAAAFATEFEHELVWVDGD